jgi:PAS domain-containing protein
MKYIIFTVFIFLYAIPSFSKDIVLNNRTIFVRKGFDEALIRKIPGTGDTSWIHIPPREEYHGIRIMDLPLPDKPVKSFLSFRDYPEDTYTILASFIIDDQTFIEKSFLGLYADMIGENWAIYLNGVMIKNEIHLSGKHSITEYRTYRHVLVYLNPRLMKTGENIVAFKIIGDPTNPDTGFTMSTPIIIGDYNALAAIKMKLLPLLLVVVYLMAGLYHLVIFLFRRSERHNLFFGLFSIMLFIYFFCRTSAIYYLIPNSNWTEIIEFSSLYALFPLIMYYMEIILFGRIRPFVSGYALFCSLLIVSNFLVPHTTKIDILRVWQYSSIIPVIYFIIFQMGYAFLTTIREYRSSAANVPRPGLARSLAHTLVDTVPGNLVIGGLVTVGCTVFDVLDALYFSTGVVATNYGFLLFVIGVTFVLSNRFIYLYSEIDGLTIDLREKSSDLKETRVKYGISQEKYRLLVEGSTDIIFSMDEAFKFLTANRAMRDLVQLGEKEIGVKTLFDVLHEIDYRSVSFQFIQNKLEQFVADKKPLHLKLDFKTSFGIEPTSLQVRLEYINIEGKYEIFGRGTSISEDLLNKYLEGEHQHFRIGNLLLVADDLSFRITRNLDRFIEKREQNLVRIAVREMIINSIEHGNLAITFEQKTKEMLADNYLTYLNKRQKDPDFMGRKVEIRYQIYDDKVEYIVTDEGAGFDYNKYLCDQEEDNGSLLPHGRGISLAKDAFDEIRYNDKGNSVTLIKWFRRIP